MKVKDFVDRMIAGGYSPEDIKKVMDKAGYRTSLPALRKYVKKNPSKSSILKNPSCNSAGMSDQDRKDYNKIHGSNVKKGVTNITSMEKLRRWGAWATRFYGRKDQPALVKGKHYTPLSCSAIAWGKHPPANWREAKEIYRLGKEALDIYKALKDDHSPKQTFTMRQRNWLNKQFLDFVK